MPVISFRAVFAVYAPPVIYIFVLRVTISHRERERARWGGKRQRTAIHASPSKWLMHSSNVDQAHDKKYEARSWVACTCTADFLPFIYRESHPCFQVRVCACALWSIRACLYVRVRKVLHRYLISWRSYAKRRSWDRLMRPRANDFK